MSKHKNIIYLNVRRIITSNSNNNGKYSNKYIFTIFSLKIKLFQSTLNPAQTIIQSQKQSNDTESLNSRWGTLDSEINKNQSSQPAVGAHLSMNIKILYIYLYIYMAGFNVRLAVLFTLLLHHCFNL